MMQSNCENVLVGCIADDFTGGSDAASFLRKSGLHTVLLNGLLSPEILADLHPDAIVVALKSRSIPVEDAVRQSCEAAKWLLGLGAQHLYFKYCSTFDSTPQGNIGPVTDALLDLLNAPYTVLCPSLPVNGRTVRDGILYVNGVPLAESHMKDHPINPMTKSDLSELMMEQSQYPCIVLGQEDLQQKGPWKNNACPSRFTLVPPYATDEDGQQIAERFGDLPLLTGGSGLLEHLGRYYKQGQAETAEVPHDAPLTQAPSPRLLLAGSCSAMTQRQVQQYLDAGGAAVRIEPDKLLSGEQTEEQLCQAIAAAQGDILVYSTATPEAVKEYQAVGAEKVSSLLEGLMGRLAVFGQAHGYRRIAVAGGETAGAVTQALGTAAYWIGEDVAPGVPELRPVDHPELRLVLKSGNFGDPDFFLTAMKSNHC